MFTHFQGLVKKKEVGKCSSTVIHLSGYFCRGHPGNKCKYTLASICIQFHFIFNAANEVTLENNLSLN